MKKVILVVVLAVIVIGGGYLIFHKSPKSNPSTSTSNTSNAPAVNNSVLVTKTSSGIGQYLADPSGKALYTYSADTSGASNCTGSCLATWPAYIDKGSTSNLPSGVSTIKRTDNGQIQYTYNGKPLYFFISDSSGQVTGDGVSNFSVAKPTSSTSTQPSTSSNSNSTPSTPAPASNNNSGYSY